jgi:LacI family transcriptional regulator
MKFNAERSSPTPVVEMKKILLLIETASGYGRQLLNGIGQYVREHGPWNLFFAERSLYEPLPKSVDHWKGDGIMSRTATRRAAERLRALRIPVVELLGVEPDGPAKIHGDNVAGGRMAAEHLQVCGLKNFGFFAFGDAWWIDMFREGFQQAIEEQHFECQIYAPHSNTRLLPQWRDSQTSSALSWLRSLPRPAGVFAPGMEFANRLLDLCRSIGRAVPEDIAVLVAVDDPTVCNVATPPLTSVDMNGTVIGYEAAALLDRMMAGEEPPKHTLWMPPSRVVVRQSSDILALDDPDVAQAVRFIRQHACQGIGVPQVSDATGLSRRMLERKFRQHLNCTPKQEIMRVKIDRARSLLGETNLSIEQIVRRSGFRGYQYFASIFSREAGCTPRAYRKKHYFKAANDAR